MIRNVLCALCLTVIVFTTVSAQDNSLIENQHYNGPVYYIKPSHSGRIDWMPKGKEYQRYTLAIRPFYLINNGIKLDFEYELREPGQWLQIQLLFRGIGTYAGTNRGYVIAESDFDPFTKLAGAGLGVAYKTMLNSRGWYFSIATTFDYIDVDYSGTYLYAYAEDGNTLYQQRDGTKINTYFKPAFSFNFGKHIAITRRMFIDGYIGLGYTACFQGNGNNINIFNYSMYGWGYSGITFNGGFRIGWVLGKMKK